MPSLPNVSGREVVKAFGKDRWEFARQKGSHMIMVKPGQIASLSIPDHKEIAKGTLRSLIRASGLSVEDFIELLG